MSIAEATRLGRRRMAHGLLGVGRTRTRGVALDLIRAAGTISRVDLAARLGLTAPAITQVVRDLIASDLVIEVGQGPSTGGKPPTLLQLNPKARYSVGVHLERNTCVIVVVDLAGRSVSRKTVFGAASMKPQQVLPVVASEIDSLLAASGVVRDKVVGVGLVTYGPQDWPAGVLLTPQPTPEWLDYPVAEQLAEALRLPVRLDNDANAAAIGEYWLGSVDPRSAFGCIYMATGIGGAVVVAGKVYRGSSSNCVEIGHISVDVHGEPCTCGNRGCLESYAGPPAVIQRALATPDLARRLGLDPRSTDVLTEFARITTAASTGDPAARTLIEQAARYLGHAAVTLTNLFDLDVIVLAGPGFGPAVALYQDVIQAELDQRWFSRRAHPVRLTPSANGDDAAAIGGAVLVLQNELTWPS
jgi:predicted NBD/HSP70 family sugar kinase